MAARYTTSPRAIGAGDEWWPEERHTITVHEHDGGPHDTGLVNVNGEPIYRVDVRVPIGFRSGP